MLKRFKELIGIEKIYYRNLYLYIFNVFFHGEDDEPDENIMDSLKNEDDSIREEMENDPKNTNEYEEIEVEEHGIKRKILTFLPTRSARGLCSKNDREPIVWNDSTTRLLQEVSKHKWRTACHAHVVQRTENIVNVYKLDARGTYLEISVRCLHSRRRSLCRDHSSGAPLIPVP